MAEKSRSQEPGVTKKLDSNSKISHLPEFSGLNRYSLIAAAVQGIFTSGDGVMDRNHGRSHPLRPVWSMSAIPILLFALGGILGNKLTLAEDSESFASEELIIADNSINTSEPPEAPSPWWLVVMPAIPLMGGGLIYTKRRFFGSSLARQECSSSTPCPESDIAVPQIQYDETEQG